jgi:Protein of unknown function (DUF664)
VRKLDQYVWAGQGHPSRRQAARDAERSPRETTAPAAGGRPVAGSAGRVQVLPARRSPWLISWATTLPSPAAAVVMDAASLDAVSAQRNMSLRWILLHLVEETARHLGHIDLLREWADGSTGEEPTQ